MLVPRLAGLASPLGPMIMPTGCVCDRTNGISGVGAVNVSSTVSGPLGAADFSVPVKPCGPWAFAKYSIEFATLCGVIADPSLNLTPDLKVTSNFSFWLPGR